MYTFLLLLIPCFLLWYSFAFNEFKASSFVPLIAMGGLAGMFFCCVLEFFIFSSHIWSESFAEGMVFLCLKETVLPSVIVFAVYLLACIKIDTWDYKTSAFLPLMAAFYMTYVPYSSIVTAGVLKHEAFMLFVRPALFLGMTWLVQNMITLGWRLLKKGNFAGIVFFVIALVLTAVPSYAEMSWRLSDSMLIGYVAVGVEFVVSILLYFLVQRKPSESVKASENTVVSA